MERKYLIPSGGKFYKAALHTHTTISDGRCTPEEVKELYKSLGYSVVAFTDHSRLVCHNDLTDEEFLAINAYEYEVNHGMIGGGEECYHLNFYAKTPDVDKQVMFDPRIAGWCYSEEEMKKFNYVGEPVESEYSVEFINKAIKAANDNGFMVCYNHPVWSWQNEKDFLGLEGLFGFEIYNHASEVAEQTGYAPHMYTSLLREGKLLGCLATDDSHSARTKDLTSPQCDVGGGYVMIKAEELSYSAIIEALEQHNFYASTGVEIEDLYIEYDNVYIRTSPCKQITMFTDCMYRQSVRANGDEITEAVLKLSPRCKAFWILCTDVHGKIAATCAAPAETIPFAR
ncbi:MAG: PHP domain-containing protein [Ruminococcaceae bacterium]|nr:PHP domain-containing protein [Oscillospiraceae bacterium]